MIACGSYSLMANTTILRTIGTAGFVPLTVGFLLKDEFLGLLVAVPGLGLVFFSALYQKSTSRNEEY